MANSILVGFSTKHNDWISRLICWLTRWKHSHVVLISPDQAWLIESTSFTFPDPETGEMRDGVRKVPVAYLFQRDMVEIRRINHPRPDLVWKNAQQMAADKVKYDHKYIGAWLLHNGCGDEQKVACHELIEVCAKAAGYALLPDDVKLTSPRDLYLLSKEL